MKKSIPTPCQTKLIGPDPSLLDSIKDPRNSIINEFEGLNSLLSLQCGMTDEHYLQNCLFLRQLKKCVADFEYLIRSIPSVSLDSEEHFN